MLKNFTDSLACPKCQGNIESTESDFSCRGCNISYPKKNGQIYFRVDKNIDHLINISEENKNTDGVILKAKAFVKKWPWLFSLLYWITAPFVGEKPEKFVKRFTSDSLILNLGSGSKVVGENVVNIDYDPFPAVQLVADVNYLPFKTDSVDAIVCESVLEHLPDPRQTVVEARRVLKPGGKFYIVTPFMLGYHASPYDYYRWTEYGMKELLEGLELEKTGIAWGPVTSLTYLMGANLALILSFGSKTLYQIWLMFFAILFGPITRFDHLLSHHPKAKDNAHGLYFIAVKK